MRKFAIISLSLLVIVLAIPFMKRLKYFNKKETKKYTRRKKPHRMMKKFSKQAAKK